ncbi:hypothetical protein EHS25_005356 [Saitozyma podzolica]|uniref:CNH domain-containing protein n=1 Tax=Saitozyma podzolica TaxID=1890683 RepID=A0A427XY42_9TREE|nr:hypothetical protein EHS25_005356 [Saitozyma podzolica]
MAQPTDGSPPFHLQPVLSELYHTRDLLDLSAPGPSSPPLSTSPQPPSSSIFSSATSIAAAAGRRAAAVASAAASPGSSSSSQFRNTLSPDRARGDAQNGEQQREVKCVEGYGQNLYIGGSDGVVEWWVCDGGAGSSHGQGWTLRHKHTLFPRRPVSKIILLPRVSRAFILSDGTLHPLALPNLEVLPSTVIAPLRGVTSVVLDDEELGWDGGEDRGGEMTVVVVRRKGLGIYKLGSRMVPFKEIPLPSAPTHSALFSTYFCAAMPGDTQTNYSVIDLSDASLTEVLPVSQIDASVLDFEPNPNVVVIPGENEFLVTSYTGASTMGVFLNGQGDPVRGTMEWTDHPLSIAVESGFIIALLRNNTVVIHSLSDLEKPVQTVDLDPLFSEFTLSYSPYGVSVRDVIRDERMTTTRLLLLGGKVAPPEPVVVPREAKPLPSPEEGTSPTSTSDPSRPSLNLQHLDEPVLSSEDVSPAAEEPPSGSGLTPPSTPPPFSRQPITPTRTASLLHSTAPSIPGPFSTAVAETLIVGPNGIMSLAPTPTVLRLEKLCTERRMEEAIALATHQATLRLLHLYLACHLFIEAMFERAGDYFVRGKVDPRLLVRAFPAFRGKLIGSAEEVEVYEGLREILADMPTVDSLISSSIKRNYSPHVQPDSESAPETQELRDAMMDNAKAMLTEVLRKTRTSRRKGGGARGVDSRKIDIVIDTTLAKLLADAGTTNELLALLAGPNDAVLSELEPFLAQRPYVLSTVMRRQGRVDRVLELLQQVAESPTPDSLCPDPADEIAQQLETVKDAELFRRYALWLVARDILTAPSKTGVKLDDVALVDDLRNISQVAAGRYLEYVVVAKKSPAKELHEDLLGRLLDEAEEEVKDDGVKYHLEELDAEYRLQVDPEPFCVFVADVAPDTPIKSLRLKLMLFLQGSPFYDLQRAASRLEGIDPLKPELAIVLGRSPTDPREGSRRLGIGPDVLYLRRGGHPPKVGRRVARKVPAMEPWAALGEVGRRKRTVVEEGTQTGLVMELLGVYMRDGASTSKEAAALLNAQSIHLDVLPILEMVPSEWPLDVVSSFVQRSLRRQLHAQASWRILKSISSGQNLQVAEAYLDSVRRVPGVVQEGPSPGQESFASRPDEGSIAEKEAVYDEKEEGLGTGEGGFFSPKAVDKELRTLEREQAEEGGDARREVS